MKLEIALCISLLLGPGVLHAQNARPVKIQSAADKAAADKAAADKARDQAAADAAWPKTGPTPPLPIADDLPKLSKIILVGDSTLQVQSGWGPSFCGYHVESNLVCLNMAKGGRSTSSYRAERLWEVALDEMKVKSFAETYVLIQFGHNDQPGKAGRSTDLVSEFPVNLKRYVEETRAAGAIPVLVTPLPRRAFKDGKLENNLLPWANAVRKVAAQMKVPVVDLNAVGAEALRKMGPHAADELAELPPGAEPPPQPAQDDASPEPQGQTKLSFDYTHLGRAGADHFAILVTRELARVVPALRRSLIP